MKGREIMENENTTPLASEMYADLKETNMFLRKLLIGAIAVIAVLVVGLVVTTSTTSTSQVQNKLTHQGN